MAGDQQISVIRQYEPQRRIPVYYLLYNPFRVPWTITLPSVSPPPVEGNVEVGTRVFPSAIVHAACEQLLAGVSPTLAHVRAASEAGHFAAGPDGWALPAFMVDHVLQCREGRVINPDSAGDLFNLFYRRTGPISAAIAVTIDVPRDDLLPEQREGQHPMLGQ